MNLNLNLIGWFQVLWDNMKRNAMKKFQDKKKTGAGGDQQLSQLDDAVIDIVGRDSVHMKGLPLPDFSPQMSQKLSIFANSDTAPLPSNESILKSCGKAPLLSTMASGNTGNTKQPRTGIPAQLTSQSLAQALQSALPGIY